MEIVYFNEKSIDDVKTNDGVDSDDPFFCLEESIYLADQFTELKLPEKNII